MISLKQKTISNILKEAGLCIAALEKHAGLIAECEALAAQLNKAAGDSIFNAIICPHASGNLSAWVQTERQRSEVYAAISRAGITFSGETPCQLGLGRTTVHLKGLDVTISADFKLEQLAEAA